MDRHSAHLFCLFVEHRQPRFFNIAEIIDLFLQGESGYQQIDINPNDFKLDFKINKIDDTSAQADMHLTGSSLPRVNQDLIKKSLKLRTIKSAGSFIKKNVPKIYDYKIEIIPSSLEFLQLTPVKWQNINLEIKS